MSIWSSLLANPDIIIGAVSGLLGLLGVKRWRTSARESTAAEVDRWASTAVGLVTIAIRTGVLKKHGDAVEQFLRHFKVLAAAAGVQVTVEHEARALGFATRALTAAGQDALEAQAAELGRVAEQALGRLERLPWPKAATKAQR